MRGRLEVHVELYPNQSAQSLFTRCRLVLNLINANNLWFEINVSGLAERKRGDIVLNIRHETVRQIFRDISTWVQFIDTLQPDRSTNVCFRQAGWVGHKPVRVTCFADFL